VFNILGFFWPNIDEEKLRGCAVIDRKLATQCDTARAHTAAATAVVTSHNKGKAATAFGGHSEKVSVHLSRLKTVYEVTADALDGLADVVEAAKIAVIAQLTLLAGEIAVAAAASIFTFGISDALGLAATAATRITVQGILDELERQAVKFAEMVVAGTAFNALMASVASLAEQSTKDYLGPGAGSARPRRWPPGGRLCE